MTLRPLVLGLIAGVLSCLAGTASATDPAALGRLFLAPETRQALERQRQLNITRQVRSLEDSSMRLDGVVVRSSGKSTVWINNRPQDESARETDVTATVSSRQPHRAMLVTGSDAPADLKVGVTLDRATRETSGGLAEGEIRIRRPAAQK